MAALHDNAETEVGGRFDLVVNLVPTEVGVGIGVVIVGVSCCWLLLVMVVAHLLLFTSPFRLNIGHLVIL